MIQKSVFCIREENPKQLRNSSEYKMTQFPINLDTYKYLERRGQRKVVSIAVIWDPDIGPADLYSIRDGRTDRPVLSQRTDSKQKPLDQLSHIVTYHCIFTYGKLDPFIALVSPSLLWRIKITAPEISSLAPSLRQILAGGCNVQIYHI